MLARTQQEIAVQGQLGAIFERQRQTQGHRVVLHQEELVVVAEIALIGHKLSRQHVMIDLKLNVALIVYLVVDLDRDARNALEQAGRRQ